MPIIVVEDGSATNPNANSYISIADADAYLVPRGLWPVTPDVPGGNEGDPAVPDPVMTAAKESALLRAADYLNTLQWYGQPVDWQRTMAWPRIGVQLPDGGTIPMSLVPKAVAQAQAELAGLIYGGTNPLAPVERGGKVIAESHSTTEGSIDVIGGDSKSDSYTYADGAPIETYFPAVSGLLRALLSVVPGKSGARIVEAGRG